MRDTSTDERGREADKPSHLPMRGWKDIASRVKERLKENHVSIVSAGIAFYFFLALFPAMAAALSIYGLVMDTAQVEQQVNQLTNVLPEQARQMIGSVLQREAAKAESSLGWSLFLSVMLSLWSANKGTKAIFEGVNITYNEKDERGFLRANGITVLFTLGSILVLLIAIAVLAAFPVIIDTIDLPSLLERTLQVLVWLILAVVVMLALAVVYKVAPDRESPKLRWTSTGAIVATALWLAGSLLFSFLVSNFGSFDETYGSFAAVIILMLWFFLTGFVILLGAEINAETEHQTSRDTTTGEDKPLGQRGGYYADHVAGKNPAND